MVIESQLDQSEQLKRAIRRMLVPCGILMLVAIGFFIFASIALPGGMGSDEMKVYFKYITIPFVILIIILVIQKTLRGTATGVKFSFYPEKVDVHYEGDQTPDAVSYKYADIKKLYVSKGMLTINPVYKVFGEASIDFTNAEDLNKVAKAIEKHCPNIN